MRNPSYRGLARWPPASSTGGCSVGTIWRESGRDSPTFALKKILALGVDSNRETKSPLDFNRECVGEPQISLLREQLKNPYYDENGHLKVVYLHHRPIDFAGPVETIMGLDDKEEFLDAARGADLVLFGHRHQKEIIHNRHGIGVLVGAPPAFEGEYVEIGVSDDNHISVLSYSGPVS
uniref:Calcineurin-like phosphoesterase n=1 Tax=Candidatus Kentrum sp. TC TaxID=2126339 RepID=A0A450Z6M5_9GAMM|nr:MAG: hypothetical protein BECKTC1821E_GA0114239_11902 [Candidatus Kentron sp. TC]